MQVRETNLEELVGGTKQFRVPLFQRPYTWKESNLSQLWRDILSQYEALRSDTTNGNGATAHFLGSFVLAPYPAPASAVTSFVVVDGQQRLTTLLLALCALRDTAGLTSDQERSRIHEQYIVNRWQDGEDQFRLLPSKPDRPSFIAVVEDEAGKGDRSPIGDAYRHFAARLSEPDPDGSPLDLALIERAIVRRLLIVDITAQAGDNVHRIFESLNATGVGLTQADLLRNYLMMLLPTRADVIYEQVWLPMQQEIGADNLEGLARVDLQRRGLQVRSDDVYREQQKRLRPIEHDEAAVEVEIRDLGLRARHYNLILNPELEAHPGVSDRLLFLRRWGAQTTHPLLMMLLELRDNGSISSTDIEHSLEYLESFLVRRLLTGTSRKNLNRIFPMIVKRMRDNPETNVAGQLRRELSGERLYWATDEAVRKAARSDPFYFSGRAVQRRMVLERIEEGHGHKELGDLAALNLQVEHIMPQTLSDEWRAELAATGEPYDVLHSELKHTLGNLTLSGYNAELSNKPFERKQQIFQSSHLSLNQALASEHAWGREQILARAEALTDRICDLWPPPVVVRPTVDTGPNWSRMHAAVAAIPPGNWTSFADLAELVGSKAQTVASQLAMELDMLNRHRVLQADGQLVEGFQWSSPEDDRDVLSVLRLEGLDFDSDGSADPEARLGADDLIETAGLAEEVVEDDPDLDRYWTADLIVRCYAESPPPMKAMLRHLAAHPDRTFTTAQIGEAVDRTPRQMAGVLGAFGNRVKNRYGMDHWPFQADWSGEASSMLYRMPADNAATISAADGKTDPLR